ncbi:Tll0287-like domain-containing protein [Mesohalobacter salilacus]|uniref:Tll0287-like domain-containing protein n=1 Tax=Mesohalobacter salilacus TaxID=2491711 RepID=UPI00269812AD
MKYLILLLVLVSVACKSDKQSKPDYKILNSESKIAENQDSKSYEIMKTQCYTCHNPETEHDNRIAPPMVAVKMHYMRGNPTEEEFTQSILNFVNQPTKEKSKMKGAVSRFGVMPYQKFNESNIKSIASYMYNYKLDKPEWFDEHIKGEGMKPYQQRGNQRQKQKRKGPKQKGMDIAMATKKELGKKLMNTIAEKGTAEAVEFCNLKAIPITSEKEKQFNAKIKRASDKPRNPDNLATAQEEVHINTFKEMIANSESPEPIVEKNNGKFDFYYPIVTNSMCLKCHGEVGETIKTETYKTIKLKYPEDKAIDYDANQVRGIWHIEFQKDKS